MSKRRRRRKKKLRGGRRRRSWKRRRKRKWKKKKKMKKTMKGISNIAYHPFRYYLHTAREQSISDDISYNFCFL